MSKHTPGPWGYYENRDEFFGIYPADNSSVHFATVGWSDSSEMTPEEIEADKDEAEANARLIAAAPELLEALIEVEKISRGHHDQERIMNAWDKACAAIAKAKGG